VMGRRIECAPLFWSVRDFPARRAEFAQPGVSTPGGSRPNNPQAPQGRHVLSDCGSRRGIGPAGLRSWGGDLVLGLTPQAEQIPPCGRSHRESDSTCRGVSGLTISVNSLPQAPKFMALHLFLSVAPKLWRCASRYIGHGHLTYLAALRHKLG
jgi:hypothetical protein